jgi:hypothetical protein
MEISLLKLESVTLKMEELLAAMQMAEADDEITAMFRKAEAIAKPAALYASFAPTATEKGLAINHVTIPEPFVTEMLADCSPVVPYVATCGTEIDEWSEQQTDMLAQFIADNLKQLCLNKIMERLFEEVHARFYQPEKPISTLNPGSLTEWPLTGQTPLFAMLGGRDGVSSGIGVTLSESLLMSPNKTVSGIMFQSAEPFHNCQLCPHPNCVGRRVPYVGL